MIIGAAAGIRNSERQPLKFNSKNQHQLPDWNHVNFLNRISDAYDSSRQSSILFLLRRPTGDAPTEDTPKANSKEFA
jgi:hypothetical protein